jgi:DNA uptake protein ComE-like DNA-binding protein
MRRTFLLITAGVALVLAGVAWLAAAQLGEWETDSRPQDSTPVSVQASPQAKVDINQAGLEELTRLPGITPAIAERIAQHRPYRKLDDLVTRKVLGKKQFARIREYVVVHPRNP